MVKLFCVEDQVVLILWVKKKFKFLYLLILFIYFFDLLSCHHLPYRVLYLHLPFPLLHPYPLIHQQICILYLLIILVLASESLICQLLLIEFAHKAIIELIPFLIISFNESIIVATIHNASMDNNSLQLILKILFWVNFFRVFDFAEVLLRVLFERKFGGELTVVIKFDPLINFIVVLKSFQANSEVIWQLLYRLPF